MIAPTYAELRRLLAEATQGPWEHSDRDLWGCVRGPTHTGIVLTLSRSNEHDKGPDGTRATGRLIAAMRNALPALLTEAEAGRKLREAVRHEALSDYALDACDEYDAAVAKGGAE